MNQKQFNEITKWQKETFGQATSHSKACHLRDEVEELIESLENSNKDNIKMEFADCFILLFGAASCNGMTMEDIQKCIDDKMGINYKRKWGKPDGNGVVKHIK